MRTFKPWNRCALACALATTMVVGTYGTKTTAQSGPSSLPLLNQNGLSYLGGFRLPSAAINGLDFTYGGTPIAFNPAGNSLFVGDVAGNIAEISIPTPVDSSDPKAMPAASYLQQAFVDPTEGHMSAMSTSTVTLYGLLVHRNRLIGAASIYYDANYSQRVSHFSRSLSLTQPSFSGWSSVWDATRSGMVSGWMAAVPPEWQSALGGPAITGQGAIPIISRTSYGPAAFSFDPAQVGQPAVPATPLLYYDSLHPNLGRWEDSNPTYGMATRIGGVAIIAGTRTALFVGSNGTGPACYGYGTSDSSLVGKPHSASDPTLWCYDPDDSNKGTHSYPYRYQVWAYDLNDFVAVKNGAKQPWDVKPYGVWPMNFPTSASKLIIGGVGYDPQNQILYVSQRDANRGNFSASPIIHAFKMSATPGSAPPASNLVNAVTMTADKTAPRAPGTAVTFTAQATGGTAPYQYKWVTSDGVTSTVAANWTASNKYTWTPTVPNSNYRVGVWVRSAGNTADAAEAITAMAFPINTGTASSVTLTANRNAPQAPMTAITWTAVPTGGVAPHEYKFMVSDGTTSRVAAAWSTMNSFTWTPSTANANYRVTVWVRSAGNTQDAKEAEASAAFAIQANAPPATSTPAPNAPRPNEGGGSNAAVSRITLRPHRPAPQTVGSTVIWTTEVTGGSGPMLYKFLVSNGSTWTTAANWQPNGNFVWTPSTANANYRVAVWVKRASSDDDRADASAEQAYAITAAAPTPASRVSQVTLTTDKKSPVAASTTVVATAQAVGGIGPYQYQWWIHDGTRWNRVTDFTASNTYSWRPTAANAAYQIGVWVRSAGSTDDRGEATTQIPFVVTAR